MPLGTLGAGWLGIGRGAPGRGAEGRISLPNQVLVAPGGGSCPLGVPVAGGLVPRNLSRIPPAEVAWLFPFWPFGP